MTTQFLLERFRCTCVVSGVVTGEVVVGVAVIPLVLDVLGCKVTFILPRQPMLDCPEIVRSSVFSSLHLLQTKRHK